MIIKDRPNIVCIMPDDTDFSLISAYGGRIPTPNIDSIAEEGTLFEQMYCSASACTPSRYTYLTGHYAGRCPDPHFIAQNPLDEPYNVAWNTDLNAAMPSLGKVLQEHGYRTGISGKWHVGRPRAELALPEFAQDADPDDPEVDAKLRQYQARLAQEVRETGGFDYAASVVWGNNESFPVAALREHNLEWITKGALDFLDECDEEQPFFLYVTPTAFHGPPHDESYLKDEVYTQGGKLEAPLGVHPPRERMRARLEALGLPFNHDTVGITWIDDQVGAILRKLEQMGVAENTIVFFKVDHNTETGKGTCHQRGVHIPMLMKWPGVVEAGSTVSARVSNIDFLPTVLEMCGITPPGDMLLDGKSFVPLLTGERDALHDDLFFEFGYTRAVLAGKWKYIAFRYPSHLLEMMKRGELDEAPNYINQRLQGQMNVAIETYDSYFDPDQLFNIEEDPGEFNNLANDPAYAGVLEEMKARLRRYLVTFKHPYPLEVPEFVRTAHYRRLVAATRAIGTDHISWWPKSTW